MTEEHEQKADEYAEKHAFRVPYDGSNKFYDDVDFKASKEGYLAGAEPREKRIAKLEEENRYLRDEIEDLTAYCDQIGKIKTGVLKLFEHVVAK